MELKLDLKIKAHENWGKPFDVKILEVKPNKFILKSIQVLSHCYYTYWIGEIRFRLKDDVNIIPNIVIKPNTDPLIFEGIDFTRSVNLICEPDRIDLTKFEEKKPPVAPVPPEFQYNIKNSFFPFIFYIQVRIEGELIFLGNVRKLK